MITDLNASHYAEVLFSSNVVCLLVIFSVQDTKLYPRTLFYLEFRLTNEVLSENLTRRCGSR